MALTVSSICVFLVFESTPALHLALTLTLTCVYINPSTLLPDHFSDVIFELLPA